jgi:hypothetical protein
MPGRAGTPIRRSVDQSQLSLPLQSYGNPQDEETTIATTKLRPYRAAT